MKSLGTWWDTDNGFLMGCQAPVQIPIPENMPYFQDGENCQKVSVSSQHPTNQKVNFCPTGRTLVSYLLLTLLLPYSQVQVTAKHPWYEGSFRSFELAECVGINRQATPQVISRNLFWFIIASIWKHWIRCKMDTNTHISPFNKAHKCVSRSSFLKLKVKKPKIPHPPRYFQNPLLFTSSLEGFHTDKILGGWIPTFQKEPRLSTEKICTVQTSR